MPIDKLSKRENMKINKKYVYLFISNGMRKDGSLWEVSSSNISGEIIFKRYKSQKESYNDLDIYANLQLKMEKIPLGDIYSNPPIVNKKIKVNKNGTLYLLPIVKHN